MYRKAEIDETPNQSSEELWLTCHKCDTNTAHKILTHVKFTESDEYISVWEHFRTVQCQGCKSVSLFHETFCSEEVGWNPYTHEEELIPTRKYYPSRVEGRPPLRKKRDLPGDIISIYEETHAALCNNLPVLTGIGMRAIIETVCTDRKAKGNNLEQRINRLVSLGLVTQDGAAILHNLRFMGNKAAHEVVAHTASELNAAFDVVEHLLVGVYIIPKEAKKLSRKQPQNIPEEKDQEEGEFEE